MEIKLFQFIKYYCFVVFINNQVEDLFFFLVIGVLLREIYIRNLEVLDSYEMYVCYEYEFSVVVVLFLYKL